MTDKSKASKSKAMKNLLCEEPDLQRACFASGSKAQAHMPRGIGWLIDPLAIGPILQYPQNGQMFDSTAVNSANCNNGKAGSDAGTAPRSSAAAQQCRVEGAWFGRDDPSKHLVELCEHIILTNALQRQLIEEVILTLKRVNSGSQQLEGNSAPAEEFHQRISYGTDHLRAGAGACELVCSQAMLFELGCLLLNHARSCQQKEEPAT